MDMLIVGVCCVFVDVFKAIANGYPMGAVVTTPEIASAFDKKEYFNTFVCSSLFFTHHSSFITHHSSFITHHSSFIIHHSSFIIHHS
jgi:adenosylmethionine-8-amino-7-oxononanoate aminotransferase